MIDVQRILDFYPSPKGKGLSYMVKYSHVSEQLLIKHKDKLPCVFPNSVVKHQVLSENFCKKYIDELGAGNILHHQICSEQMIEYIYQYAQDIRIYKPEEVFQIAASHQKLSEAFILKHLSFFDLDVVNTYQILSEKFRKETGLPSHKHIEDLISTHSWQIYTTHESIITFKCNKCNIISTGSKFQNCPFEFVGQELSCDEFIIKNIIE